MDLYYCCIYGLLLVWFIFMYYSIMVLHDLLCIVLWFIFIVVYLLYFGMNYIMVLIVLWNVVIMGL